MREYDISAALLAELKALAPTVTDLIRLVEKRYGQYDLLLCGVKLNGNWLDEADEDAIGGANSDSVVSLTVKASSRKDLVRGTFESLRLLIADLVSQSQSLARLLETPERQSWHPQFDRLISYLNEAVAVMDMTKNTVRGSNVHLRGWSLWNSAESTLKSVIESLFAATEAEDFLWMSDLVGFELIESLEFWLELLADEQILVAGGSVEEPNLLST